MKKTYLFTLALLITFGLYSQNAFQSGSYTNNQQKTTSGLIKVISDNNIVYKESTDSKEIMFTAETAKGYTLDDPFKKFVSLSEDNKSPAFFEYIVDSSISLLILNNIYFVHDQNNGLKKLEVKKITKSTDKGVFESTINSYVGILSYYAKDCETSLTEVNSVKYNRKSLSDFIIKLNQCNNNEINDYSVDNAVNLLDIGITAGGNSTTFEDATTGGYKTGGGGSYGLSLGGFVSYSPNISKYNLSFILGVEYNQKKDDYTYNQANFAGERTVTHDASVIEPYLAAIYQPFYNKKGLFSPYIGVGTSYGFTLKHDIEVIDLFSEESYESEVDQSFSFLFKVGTIVNIKENKFLVELVFSNYSYQTEGNAENYGGNFQAKIGYVFNLKK